MKVGKLATLENAFTDQSVASGLPTVKEKTNATEPSRNGAPARAPGLECGSGIGGSGVGRGKPGRHRRTGRSERGRGRGWGRSRVGFGNSKPGAARLISAW